MLFVQRFFLIAGLFLLGALGAEEKPFFSCTRFFPDQNLAHETSFFYTKVSGELEKYPKKDVVCFFSYEDLCALQQMEEGQELFKVFGSSLDAIIDRVKMQLMYFGKAREYQKSEQFNCVFLEHYKNFTVKIDFLKTGSTKKVVVSFKGFADQPPVAFVNFFKKLLVDDIFLKKHWVGMIQGLAVAAGAGFLFKHKAQVGNARRCFSQVNGYLGQQISAVFNDVAKSTLNLARNIPGQELLGLSVVEQYQKLCARYPLRYGYLAGSNDTLEEIFPGIYLGQYVPYPEIGVLVVDLDKPRGIATTLLNQFTGGERKKEKKSFFWLEHSNDYVSAYYDRGWLFDRECLSRFLLDDLYSNRFKDIYNNMSIRLKDIYDGRYQEQVRSNKDRYFLKFQEINGFYGSFFLR